MNFQIKANLKYPWERILQQAGYHLHNDSFVKRLSSDFYPRFHVYLRKETNESIEFNLHLDQRRGVHAGATAHAGEYDSELVINETNRLKALFEDNYL